MFKTLFAKLTLALVLIFSLLTVLTLSITFISTNLYQQEVMQRLNSEVASHIVKESNILQNERINYANLRKLFHNLMILNPSLEIYLLDHEGEILAYSAPAWKVVRFSVDIDPIIKSLTTNPLIPIKGEDPRNFTDTKVFSVASVPLKDEPDGYLYVIIGGEQYASIAERIKDSYILSSSSIAIGIGLFIIFIFGLILFSNLTKRLKSLARIVSQFENNPQANPTFPSYKKQGDEIDQLTAAFQAMASKIHLQLDELQTTDHLRREMVANVSHDLRTPLATLQGYIETLLIKESDLSSTQRQDYLRIAIKHCDRLNKLVAELFELAKLDASEAQPNPENFNIAELIEDIIQKFSLQAQEKNIQLKKQYDSIDLFVYADISLIERAIENLLENALRFTDKNGLICVSLINTEGQVTINIQDNGMGIPEAELPFIFDRFYQLDKNRQCESNHSGLGLAIVKRIIDLHKTAIQVSSIPGKETTFSFRLLSQQ